MGFSFRKSIKLGGVRVNLGKKGISASTGTKGLRMTTGTNGTRLSAGYGGLRYTTKLGKTKGTNNTYTQSNACNGYIVPTILASIAMFILGVILLYFKIFSIAFYVIFIAIIAGIIGIIMLKPKNIEQGNNRIKVRKKCNYFVLVFGLVIFSLFIKYFVLKKLEKPATTPMITELRLKN